MLAARSAVRAHTLQRLGDAARARDPTRSNDLRRRIASGLRHDLAQWRSQVYAALVAADQMGYAYGEVDPYDVEALIRRLDMLLKRQAEFVFVPGADQMDVLLRTAYARGVRRAGEETSPVLPFTTTPSDLILRARADLEHLLEDQIDIALQKLREDEELAAAVAGSRYKLYALALLPLLLRPVAKRLTATATTNVTRAFNGGKIDAYEMQGIEEVGVEAEKLPGRQHRPPTTWPEARALEEQPELPPDLIPGGERYIPESYTIETVGDDRVCDICESYEGRSYTLAEARELIPAHPNCRCSIVPLT